MNEATKTSRRALLGALVLAGQAPAWAQGPAAPAASAPPAPMPPLFLAQLTTGPAWEASKQPGEQPGFREHSTNLTRMRRAGVMLFGGRAGAKGWMILTAADLDAARREFNDDPMVQRQAFALELEPLRAFHRGALGATVTC